MPDDNKFAKLREIQYRIPVTCGICVHGLFHLLGGEWGTCEMFRYNHKKHANPEEGRGLSVTRGGTCNAAEASVNQLFRLGAHSEFLEGS